MSFLDDIKQSIQDFLHDQELTLAPKSTLFLMTVSILVSSLSGGVTRLIVDTEQLAKHNEEVQLHNKKKKKAKETADKKLWTAVSKKDKYITDLQRKMMTKRMIPSFVTFLPIIFVFSTLRLSFQSSENVLLNANTACTNSCGVVAVLPFNIPEWFPLIGSWFSKYAGDALLSVAGFGFWYFLTAITSSTLIQKVFGINLTGMQNPGMGGR